MIKFSIISNSLILITLLTYVGCSKSEDDVNKITQQTMDVTPLHVSESVNQVVQLFPMSGQVNFDPNMSINYYVVKNDYHKNGYVMINSITYKNEVYTISKKKVDYMLYIHKHSEFGATKKVGTVTLQDKEFCNVFRTAEAVLLVYFSGQDMNIGNVKDAGKRMVGRNAGVMLDKVIFE